MGSGTARGSFSTYRTSLFMFSLDREDRSATSLLVVYIHRSPEFTLLRLSRQNGQDWDLDLLEITEVFSEFVVKCRS